MPAESLGTEERKVLKEDRKLDQVALYLNKNGEATSEELRNLARSTEGSYERGEYVAVARSLTELGYVESEIKDGEMVWTAEEDFSYRAVLDEVEETLENQEKKEY